MTRPGSPRRILVAGASGFVGRHAVPALVAAGREVRCGSRSPEEQAARQGEWVELDVHRPETLEPALSGCDAAIYLVHGIATSEDYAREEAAAGRAFREAAERTGVRRVVYLGGVAPAGPPSRHLAARMKTGEELRGGDLSTVELRAGLILGGGGASWRIVRQLAERLPAMVLPRWLGNRSRPVAVDDVVLAILAALDWPGTASETWDVPGPEALSHRELLTRIAEQKGYRPPMLEVPVVTPRLSSYWIGLVTDVDLDLAKELVEGLTSDLLPADEGVWRRLPGRQPVDLDEAVRRALADPDDPMPGPDARARVEALGEAWADGRIATAW